MCSDVLWCPREYRLHMVLVGISVGVFPPVTPPYTNSDGIFLIRSL